MLVPNSVLIGSYDYREVALSILISFLASHSALALTGRVNGTHGLRRLTWLASGGTAMGAFRLSVPNKPQKLSASFSLSKRVGPTPWR
jgi:hypothetical protein